MKDSKAREKSLKKKTSWKKETEKQKSHSYQGRNDPG